ncbi:hypothetical protein ABT364_14835 [Massilia sp. SR12]
MSAATGASAACCPRRKTPPKTPWHQVLNVPPDATLEQVDQAYQSMMKTKEVRNAYAAAIKALTV